MNTTSLEQGAQRGNGKRVSSSNFYLRCIMNTFSELASHAHTWELNSQQPVSRVYNVNIFRTLLFKS